MALPVKVFSYPQLVVDSSQRWHVVFCRHQVKTLPDWILCQQRFTAAKRQAGVVKHQAEKLLYS